MVAIGEKTGRPTLGIISSMDQPLGRAVGNSLEIIESIEALKGRGPDDIMQVTYALGWCMLRAAGQKIDLRPGRRACSGRPSPRAGPWTSSGASSPPRAATRASATIIRCCPPAAQQVEFVAPASGYIARIDSFASAWPPSTPAPAAARKEDAIAYGGGFVFHANVGDRVEKGQNLVTVHSDRPEQTPAVLERLGAAIRIGPRPVAKPKMVLHLVDKDGVRPWPY